MKNSNPVEFASKKPQEEFEKFLILCDHKPEECKLDNPKNFKLYSGPLSERGRKLNTIKFCPDFVLSNFLPRYDVQYSIVSKLIDERDATKLLLINGEMGCGKSVMLRAIGNFFNERKYFDSVIYMNLRSFATQNKFAALFFYFL